MAHPPAPVRIPCLGSRRGGGLRNRSGDQSGLGEGRSHLPGRSMCVFLSWSWEKVFAGEVDVSGADAVTYQECAAVSGEAGLAVTSRAWFMSESGGTGLQLLGYG